MYDLIHERYYYDDTKGERKCKQSSVHTADIVIAISQYTRQLLLETYEAPEENVEVIPLGVTSFKADQQIVAELRRTRPFLLYVGQRGGYKNFARFLRAVAQTSAARDGVGVVAFGGGTPNHDELDLIRAVGMGDRVVFAEGGDEQLAAYYRGAIGLVYPSLDEGFGLPPLEAMSQCCPVAASRAGAMPEVLGEAPLYFDPAQVEDMISTIDRLVGDTDLRVRLVQRGGVRAALYSWDSVAASTVNAYERALEIRSQRRRPSGGSAEAAQ